MPIVEVTCSPGVSEAARRDLRDALPHVVSLAVACEQEPYDGQLRPGDALVVFRDAGPQDRFDIDVLVEVKSKWFPSRAADSQRRADEIRDGAVEAIGPGFSIGVYLSLPVAAWASTA